MPRRVGGEHGWGSTVTSPCEAIMTLLLRLRPDTMTPAQLAAVSYLARFSGATHHLYAYQLRRLRSRCGADRGLPRHPARAPSAAPGRQGRQARHNAADRAPRPGGMRGQRTHGPLVLRPLSGRPINRRDVFRMVQRIAKVAGILRHISAHSLRHACHYHPCRCCPRDGEIGDSTLVAHEYPPLREARATAPRPATSSSWLSFWPYVPHMPHTPKPAVTRAFPESSTDNHRHERTRRGRAAT